MKTVKIGGVPEHFNYPWYTAFKKKSFIQQNINLRWIDFEGGTGQMNGALREGKIDMAVILTEGIVRDIIMGNPSKIVQVFVQSPLIWGIHISHNKSYSTIQSIKGKKAAISRFGSGSHLMAFVHAKNHNWNIATDLKFKVVNDMEGAIKSLIAGQSDYFMWEKYTTKPLVDQGIFNTLGYCPTPWPCFVIAVRNEVLENEPDLVKTILQCINQETLVFKSMPNIESKLAEKYQQKKEDIAEWLSITEWSQKNLKNSQLKQVQQHLKELHLIQKTLPCSKILHHF